MIGEDRALAIAEQALSLSRADQTQVMVVASNSELTRFTNNAIHQNVAVTDADVHIRSVIGKRIGIASTNDVSGAGLEQAVDAAARIAALQEETEEFRSLPGPKPIPAVESFDEATAQFSPAARAARVAEACQAAAQNGCSAAGSLTTDSDELLIANSLGVRAFQRSSSASFSTVVASNGGTGYAAGVATAIGDLDIRDLAARAVQKALAGREPVELPAGEYPVVLEHHAVATLVEFLAYLGFGAQALQEGRSFMCGKLGQRITGENISIWDDGLDPTGLPSAFDYEGVPKRRVDLIAAGEARGVVYDTLTAAKDGKESTGHALPAGDGEGPQPLNLFMKPGDSSIDEMIAATERGIYVTRFHYTNVVEPMKAVLTGMTRDGTFLIEDGQLSKPIRNLRFTESALRALSNVDRISSEALLVDDVLCPAVRVNAFRFSGVTNY